MAGYGLDAANHVFDAGERAEPMRRVSKIRTGNAGKKIFRAARKTCHFMRHGGAENYYCVVNAGRQAAIEIDRNGIGNKSAGQFRNSSCAQLADRHEFFRNVPLVIIDLTQSGNRLPIGDANLELLLLVGHWHVRALGDQRVHLSDLAGGQNLCREREENIRIVITSLVRNDREHTRARSDV